MAKLKSHGEELFRIDLTTCRQAYFSDGNILRDYGDGWKLYRKLKLGIDATEHAKKRKEFFDNQDSAQADFRRAMVNEWKKPIDRARVFTVIQMLGNDLDGCWSELDDAGIGTDCETLGKLIVLYDLAVKENKEERLTKMTAKEKENLQMMLIKNKKIN